MIRRLKEEQGIALVMALGMLLALSITTVTLLEYTGSHSRDVRFLNAQQKSESIAEAGLNEALAVLYNAAEPQNPSALPPGSATYEGGSVTWSGTLGGDLWTVTATSVVKNPSGAADVSKTVSAQVRVGIVGSGNSPAWRYVYADSQTECTVVKNNAEISAPLYLRGNLCTQNAAVLTNDEITVKGYIKLTGSSSIGKSSDSVDKLHVGTGCGFSSPYTIAKCNPAYRVYATTVDSTFANVTKPTVDLDYWYASAKPGPKNSCTSGSFPGGFDNNTKRNNSRADADITPSTSYSCVYTSGGETVGQLIWNPSTGILQIAGTIYFDGDLAFSAANAVYTGRGTIYASGQIVFDNNDRLCGAANCDSGAWNGQTNMLVLVAGEDSGDGFLAQSNSYFQGGVYAVDDVKQQQSAVIEGPVIANNLRFENFSEASNWPPIEFVAEGAPGAGVGAVTLVPVSGSWTG